MFWKALATVFVTLFFLAIGIFAIMFRWDIVAGGELAVYRLDRWTGTVTHCGLSQEERNRARSSGRASPRLDMDC